MKTLTLFVAYHKNEFNDLDFVKELENISDKLVILSNKNISNLKNVEVYDNEGYDFGFWYKYIRKENLSNYDRLILVNNSNRLIRGASLSFIKDYNNTLKYDAWGLTDSFEAPPGINPDNSYHIQSHFIVFEKSSINLIMDFYNSINFEKYLKIKENLRQKIINDCEIGISQFLISKGKNIGSVYSAKEFCKKYSRDYKKTNTHVWLWEELINHKYPLIKKKLINGSWKFVNNYKNYTKYV